MHDSVRELRKRQIPNDQEARCVIRYEKSAAREYKVLT